MDRTLTVWVGNAIVHLYGTVNGTATTFTIAEDGNWEAIVPRSEDDSYALHLEAYSASGLEGTYDYTLYYGWKPVITDRTEDDVKRVMTLMKKGWANLTEAEKSEWSAGMRGAYNASDFLRVSQDVSYLVAQLDEYGYHTDITPRLNWAVSDLPSETDMAQYLSDVALLGAAFYGAVVIPETMSHLLYDGANNIEKLILEIYDNIKHMIAGWHYCGATVCGGGIL